MNADLFEGDIVLEPVQRLAVDLGIEIRGSMGNRLWPNAIVPYTIAPSLCKKNFSVLIIACVAAGPRTRLNHLYRVSATQAMLIREL